MTNKSNVRIYRDHIATLLDKSVRQISVDYDGKLHTIIKEDPYFPYMTTRSLYKEASE